MASLQNNFTVQKSVVYVDFPPMLGAAKTSPENTASSNSESGRPVFSLGQSKVLGFKRLVSSPNPADNGVPSLFYVIPYGEPPNEGNSQVIYIFSNSGTDTSQYRMYWINEQPNNFVKEELELL
jgi:hypothetical protein